MAGVGRLTDPGRFCFWHSSQETIKQLEQTLPLIVKRRDAYKTLFNRKLVDMNEYLNLEGDVFVNITAGKRRKPGPSS